MPSPFSAQSSATASRPWSPDRVGGGAFAGCVQKPSPVDMGVLGRVRTSPIVALKTKLKHRGFDRGMYSMEVLCSLQNLPFEAGGALNAT